MIDTIPMAIIFKCLNGKHTRYESLGLKFDNRFNSRTFGVYDKNYRFQKGRGKCYLQNIEVINRLEKEIRSTIRNAFDTSFKPLYQHSSGRRLFLSEVIEEGVVDGPIIGALAVVYAAGAFMSVDRIVKQSNQFKKRRRIIYYLDSRPGQIGSTLLLELLKLSDREEFSKHKFVQKIDEEYFQAEKINISSGEINEALSRMFRKTMPRFFGIKGRQFIRRPFLFRMHELNVKTQKIAYTNYKREIDNQTNILVSDLNKLPM